jgi:hypothetical protein
MGFKNCAPKWFRGLTSSKLILAGSPVFTVEKDTLTVCEILTS